MNAYLNGSALALVLACGTGAQTWAQSVAPAQLDEIVVTGTRSPGRTALESVAPIDVISAAALQKQGYVDVARGLEFLEPSVNFARAATTATAANTRPATLRGLSPDQVLVLVNGKRRHATSILNTNNTVGRGSAGVDLDAIPSAAIERIEILRDGAAAQYGSDAIAGVVNIILKSDREGGDATLQYGQTEAGDGAQVSATGHVGLPLGAGRISLTGELRDQDPTNRALVDQRFGRVTYRFGDPRVRLFSAALDAEHPLGAGELYGFATYADKRSENAAGFRVPGFSPLYPNGFLPKIQPIIRDGSATLGWRAKLADRWNFDLSHSFGYDHARFEVYDTANVSLGLASPTRFNSGAVTYRQDVTDLTLSTPLAWGAGGNLAGGLQHRYEAYEIESGEPLAYQGLGADGFAGFNPRNPTNRSRTAYAAFVDLELHPVQPITLGAAVRYDNYDDFGGATTWKASARWQVTDILALRATAGVGFRAPSLQQQYFSAVAGATSAGVLVTVGTLPVSDPVARALGAEKLKPERSRNLAGGLVFDPGHGLSFTADAFQIEIDDRIALSEQLAGPAVLAVLKSAGITNFQQVRFFTNAVDTTTRGYELTGRFRHDLPGDVSLNLVAGYGRFETKLDTLRANPVLPTLPLLGGKSILYVTKAQPKDKLTASIELIRGPLSLQLSGARFGTYQSQPLVNPQVFGAKTTVDLSARYAVTPAFHISAGVQNLGDARPDPIADQGLVIAATGGSFPTGEESPIGVNGRSYFVRLQRSF